MTVITVSYVVISQTAEREKGKTHSTQKGSELPSQGT